MSSNGSALFSPFNVGGKLALRNRIVLAPLDLGCDGRSAEARGFYVRRAQGGAGLVIAPQRTGGVDDWAAPDFGRAFRPLIDGCHAAGAKIATQVYSGGDEVNEIDAQRLASMPQRFAKAAVAAREAGFDAFEIHGAHYSLFMRLLSPFQNRRTDDYGGPQENRWRVQVDTMRAIRAAVGQGFPVLFRFSAADFLRDGVDLHLTIPYARALEAAGADCLDISAGTTDAPDHVAPGPKAPAGTHADLAASIRRATGVPVIAVGKIATREVAESILRDGKADLVALGRPLIVDPDWPKKLAERRDDEIVRCIWDNVGCLRDSISQGKPIRCLRNPDVGFDHERS